MSTSRIPSLIDRRPVYFAPDVVANSSQALAWSDEVVVERWSLQPAEWPEGVLARHRVAVFLGACPVWTSATVDGRTVEGEMRAGDIRVMPQGVVARSRWKSPFEVAMLEFSPTLLERLLDGRAPVPSEQLVPRASVADSTAYNLTRCILAELAAPTERLYGEMLCLAWAVHLLRRYGRPGTDAPRIRARLSSIHARRTLELMRANLETGVSVPELAREAGLSDAHFARAFRATFGEPPHRVMLRWRLERARRLIVQHGIRPIEAALAAGFVDQAHLTRAMNQHFGTTPGRLRSDCLSG